MNRAEMAKVVVLSRHGSKKKEFNPGLTETGKLQVARGAEQRVENYGRGGLVYVSSELNRARESKGILVAKTAPLEVVSFEAQKRLLDWGENDLLNEPFPQVPGLDPNVYQTEWNDFWTKRGHSFPDGTTLQSLGHQTYEVMRLPTRVNPEDPESQTLRTDFVGHSGNLIAFILSGHVEQNDLARPFESVRTGGSEALERELPSASWVEFTRNDDPSKPDYRITRLGLVKV